MSSGNFGHVNFVLYFSYGVIYGLVIGLVNKQIDTFKKKSPRWAHWIDKLEIERKTVHVFSFFMFLFMFEIAPISIIVLRYYIFFGTFVLGVINIIRLYNKTVEEWIEENMKGFLIKDIDNDQRWPAVFTLFLSILVCLKTVDNKSIV